MSLEFIHSSRIASGDDQIINVDAHDQATCATATGVHTVLADAALEAEAEQRSVELLVPGPWSLTESVQSLVEARHLVLVLAVDKDRRLLYVYLLNSPFRNADLTSM